MHIPVLLNEVLTYINPQDGDEIIDATFGCGGHTEAILSSCKKCNVLGIDRDPNAANIANVFKNKYPQRFTFYLGKFSEALTHLSDNGHVDNSNTVLHKNHETLHEYSKDLHKYNNTLHKYNKILCQYNKILHKYNKILFDFGVSSPQLDMAERGFSFSKNGPLDMRMSQTGKSAYDVINTFNENDLADIIYYYGEEHKAKKISKCIVQARPINTTLELRQVIVKAIGKEFIYKKYSKVDSATKTFQAIRIFVNNELEEINLALNAIPKILVPGGLVVTITFHSLEDKVVKNWIKSNNNVKLITHPVVAPTTAEISQNPRSRSAKLRAFYVN